MTWALLTGRIVLCVAAGLVALAVVVTGSTVVAMWAEAWTNGKPASLEDVFFKALVAASAVHAVNIANAAWKRTAPKETDR